MKSKIYYWEFNSGILNAQRYDHNIIAAENNHWWYNFKWLLCSTSLLSSSNMATPSTYINDQLRTPVFMPGVVFSWWSVPLWKDLLLKHCSLRGGPTLKDSFLWQGPHNRKGKPVRGSKRVAKIKCHELMTIPVPNSTESTWGETGWWVMSEAEPGKKGGRKVILVLFLNILVYF